MREPPVDFVTKLKALCGSDWDVRYNTEVQRWEFESMSAGGMRVSQFFGWYVNPLTGTKIEPDPVTGLVPFRDIMDVSTQEEILANLERSFIGNREDGAKDWETYSGDRIRYNKRLTERKRKQRAEDWADVISEVDLRRPWLSDAYLNKRQQGKRSA